jgi:hypothetical protein
MEYRLSLTEDDEKLAKSVSSAQDTSKRDAVLNVFRRHGKEYSKKKVSGFSKTKWGRPKKGAKV